MLNLDEENDNPVVGELTLQEATDRLIDGLARIVELSEDLDSKDLDAAEPLWSLVLDQQESDDMGPLGGLLLSSEDQDATLVAEGLRAVRGRFDCRTELLAPAELDPLTVVDDRKFFSRLQDQGNLPQYIKKDLPKFY